MKSAHYIKPWQEASVSVFMDKFGVDKGVEMIQQFEKHGNLGVAMMETTLTKFKITFKIAGCKQTWYKFGKTLESTLKLTKKAIHNEWPVNKLSELSIYSPPNY